MNCSPSERSGTSNLWGYALCGSRSGDGKGVTKTRFHRAIREMRLIHMILGGLANIRRVISYDSVILLYSWGRPPSYERDDEKLTGSNSWLDLLREDLQLH